jgi:hypothetical protein
MSTKILEVRVPAVQKLTQNDIQFDPPSDRMECHNSFKLISTDNKSDATVNVPVSGDGLPWNWMILLGYRRLQYIGEEPLWVAGG